MSSRNKKQTPSRPERSEPAAADRRLHLAVADAPLLLFAVDREGAFTLSEGRALNALGLKPGQMVGRSAFELYRDIPTVTPDGAVTRADDAIRRGLAGESFTGVSQLGEAFFELRIEPLRNGSGEVTSLIGVGVDVTELRRAAAEREKLFAAEQRAHATAEEAKRRLSFLYRVTGALMYAPLDVEQRLDVLARHAVPTIADWCGVDMLDDDGTIRRVAVAHGDPRKVALIWELTRRYPVRHDDPAGTARVLRTGEPEFYPLIPEAFLEQMAHDPENLRILRELGLKSGMIVPLRARERTLGALSLVYAESGRRYSEDDLALAEDLASRAGAAVDSARLHREAQEAVRMRDEFFSIASHELFTPVTSLQLAVRNLATLAERGAEGDGSRRLALEVVGRGVQRLERLVNDLLDVTRFRAGAPELERAEVDFAALVREMTSELAHDLAAAGCTAEVRAARPVVGHWDRARLEQVVANLITNAIKYGPGKPIEIAVETDGEIARLVVRDEGIGIAPEMQAHIFDAFKRAAPERPAGGLGLGLYIVRRLVEAHGGAIRVESQEGVGSTFTVDLPLSIGAAG
jgi:signal transduction histidine kinase